MAVRAVKFMHGKKAMFYTILSVMFVGFAIVLLSSEQDTYKEMDELDLVRTRVYSMNDFTRDIEQDIERALYITGFRALASEIGYIIDFGEFVDDYDLRFKEAFFEGTVMNWSQALMTNSTFNDWLSRVQYQGNKKGIV
ncbi:hypothetical protein KY311_01780, partial [Candidatus Woesearchaeota archaeon]|nr:hypothetical protein [Candidatus Woesearchaeota archaeon]